MDLAYLFSFSPAPSDLAIIALFGAMAFISRVHFGSSGKTAAVATSDMEMFLTVSALFIIGFQITWIIARLAGTA
jgi:hypothetical protein